MLKGGQDRVAQVASIIEGNGVLQSPCLASQRRQWLLRMQDERSSAYQIPIVVRMKGELDDRALHEALRSIVCRHETFRTTFLEQEGEPIQSIASHGDVELEHRDLSTIPATSRERACEEAVSSLIHRPINLSVGPLHRTCLLRLAADEALLVLVLDHILVDGASVALLVNELVHTYDALVAGREVDLPRPSGQPRDVAALQSAWLKSKDARQQRDYWKQYLSGLRGTARFPGDRDDSVPETRRGRTARFGLSLALVEEVERFSVARGVSPFMTFLSAYSILLHRHSGLPDVSVGVAVANRHDALTATVVGCLVNTVVLRTTINKTDTCNDIVEQTKRGTLNALANQDIPFDQVVADLGVARRVGETPLFRTMLAYEHVPPQSFRLMNLDCEVIPWDSGSAQFDMSLGLWRARGSAGVSLEYSTGSFDPLSVQRLAEQYERTVRQMIHTPEARCRSLQLMSRAETAALFKQQEWVSPERWSVHDRIASGASEHPNRAAVIVDGGRETTYGELYARARTLARSLLESKVEPEQLVAVAIQDDIDRICACLAVLLSGAGYLVVDPKSFQRAPAAWSEKGEKRLVIADATSAGLPWKGEIVTMSEACGARAANGADSKCFPVASRDSLACAIPCNTTAQGDGCLELSHGGLAATVDGWARAHQTDGGVRYLRPRPLGIGDAAADFWPLLCCGGTIILTTSEEAFDPRAARDAIRRHEVSSSEFDHRSALRLVELCEQDGGRLEVSEFAVRGTLPQVGDMRRIRSACPPGALISSSSGLLETGGCTTRWQMTTGADSVNEDATVVGTADVGRQIVFLDPEYQPLPTNVAGALVTMGLALGRGFRGQAAETAERFLPSPSSGYGARMFVTKYRGRRRNDGTGELIGRQELSDIQEACEEYPGVTRASVTRRSDDLVGTLELSDPTAIEEASLRRFLATRLSETMISDTNIMASARASESSGDTTAQPNDEASRAKVRADQRQERNEVERVLRAAWAELLAIPELTPDQNFFELGGDSIAMMRVVARARSKGVIVTVRQFLEHQTIASLATVATLARGQSVGAQDGERRRGRVIPLTPIQRWFFDAYPEPPARWNQTLLFECPQDLDGERMDRALQTIVSRHDVFGYRFVKRGAEWIQEDVGAVSVELATRTIAPTEDRASAMLAASNAMQESIRLDSPPLFRATVIQQEGTRPILMLAAHHLIIDAVSWSILVEDLTVGYESSKGTDDGARAAASFAQWADVLAGESAKRALEGEGPHWLSMMDANVGVIPVDSDISGDDLEADSAKVRVELTSTETDRFLSGGGMQARSNALDLFLAALEVAATQWAGRRDVIVDLEAHGREPIADSIDVGRTVGWFTSMQPFRLKERRVSWVERTAAVATERAAARYNGIGYGILNMPRQTAAQGLPKPNISVNYLGVFERRRRQASTFEPLGVAPGASRDGHSRRPHLVEIEAGVFDGKLTIVTSYNQRIHRRASIEAFGARLGDALRCALSELGPLSTSGARRTEIEDGFPLSPMQEGLLFEAIASKDPTAYAGQLSCTLDGDVDTDHLTAVWRDLIDQHPSLRIGFAWEGRPTPLQFARSRVDVPLINLDYSRLDEGRQAKALTDLAEREYRQGFDLTAPPLMRIFLTRLSPTKVKMLWSHHHILLDGWSLQIVLHELFERYTQRLSGSTSTRRALEPVSPKAYVQWLSRADVISDEAYWRQQLSRMPRRQRRRSYAPIARSAEMGLTLTVEETKTFRTRARELRVTVGALVEASWAAALARWREQNEVVFGLTVSGRPPDIEGVESMVGLFINTVPVTATFGRESTLAVVAQELHRSSLERAPHEYTSLKQLRQWAGLDPTEELFDTLLVLETYPKAPVDWAELPFEIGDLRFTSRSTYSTVGAMRLGERANITLFYDSDVLSTSEAFGLLEGWRTAVLDVNADPDGAVMRPRSVAV